MRKDVLALWPSAPIAGASSKRWVRLSAPDRRFVYIQRYAWDDQSRPDYLLVIQAGDAPAEQRRFGSLAEAVAAARMAIERSVHA